MKRLLLPILSMAVWAAAAPAQDFVSHYLTENEGDTLLHCISISPRMMGEVMKVKADAADSTQRAMQEMLADLKSVQIVSAGSDGSRYFDKAEELAAKNVRRFTPLLAFDDSTESCRILVRRREEAIIELVMFSRWNSSFRVIDFTGNMDEEFIDNLTGVMIPPKEEKEKTGP